MTAPSLKSRAAALADFVLAWVIALLRTWSTIALAGLGWIGVASTVWQLVHRPMLFDLILGAENGAARVAHAAARGRLVTWAAAGVGLAVAHWFYNALRDRRGERVRPPYAYTILIAAAGLPALSLPTFEWEHPFFAAFIVLGLALSLGHTAKAIAAARGYRLPAVSDRTGLLMVWGGYVLFVACIGFLSHWRYITFHARVYDFSWEMNAIAGIARHGIPTISAGAQDYYQGKALPAPYFNLHTPIIYYVYAPFFYVFPDPRTFLWLQAAIMGAGTFGVYWAARRWIRERVLAVILAWAWVLNPSVQGSCLHDLHANILAVPLVILGLGLMEIGRRRAAIGLALLAALCREETGLYAAGLGMYWALVGPGRRRRLDGVIVIAASLAILFFLSAILMPAFGGQPRLRHYALYFDQEGGLSVVKSLVLNPLGSLVAMADEERFTYVVLSILPWGFFALRGFRLAWLGVAAVLLGFAASNKDFFVLGINYAAPVISVAAAMGVAGARGWLVAKKRADRRGHDARAMGLAVYLMVMAISANVLYGNIASKTIKLEYGGHGHNNHEHRFQGALGYLTRLPPYGRREREIWEGIKRVPRGVPVTTSWLLNPVFSHYDVALVWPNDGRSHPAPNRARYAIFDKLPPIVAPNEGAIHRLRSAPAWQVDYENDSVIVFRRRD